MTGKLITKIKEEKGAVHIVEATFIFPIMFIILFFLIYMGNAYYIKSQIEHIVVEEAVKGAGHCVDPVLKNLEVGSIPSVSNVDLDPYRYFSGMDGVERQISQEVEQRIQNTSTSFFRNMQPVIKTSRANIAKYNNFLVYSTFSVEVKCELGFPIKFLGSATPTIMTISTRSEIAVNDTAEFIRNTDMLIDYFINTKIGRSISDVFAKINEFINKFAGS
ncbi:MAG: pilus assembly protein [Clostridia bacterium]|nr:pilus assembly protein [Clostridia bacterium]